MNAELTPAPERPIGFMAARPLNQSAPLDELNLKCLSVKQISRETKKEARL
jgi:hypothetical protein